MIMSPGSWKISTIMLTWEYSRCSWVSLMDCCGGDWVTLCLWESGSGGCLFKRSVNHLQSGHLFHLLLLVSFINDIIRVWSVGWSSSTTCCFFLSSKWEWAGSCSLGSRQCCGSVTALPLSLPWPGWQLLWASVGPRGCSAAPTACEKPVWVNEWNLSF